MKNTRMIFICILAVVLLMTSGCTDASGNIPELMEPVGMEPDNVEVTRGEIYNTVTCEGLVLPEMHDLSFGASGFIDEVLVCIGSKVSAGDVLAKLDFEMYENSLTVAESELEYNIAAWELNEKIASTEIDIAKLELEQLKNGGSAADIELKKIEIAGMENKLSTDKALWEISLEEYEENIALLKEQVSGAFLVAPCDGTVVSCSAEEGMYTLAGSDLIRLAEDDELYISVDYISADQVDDAIGVYGTVAGQNVDIAYKEMDRIEFISKNDSGKGLTSTFSITDAHDIEVESGMYAIVFLLMEYDAEALIIPSCAVRQDNSGFFVYIVDENGTQEKRGIKRGIYNDAYVQVLEGLEEGDLVYAGN